MSYSNRKRFRGIGSGAGGMDRPTFDLGVNDGRVSIIALYGGGPFAVTDLQDMDLRERIDTYARCHDLFRGDSGGRDEAVRRLIEIGLERCDEAQVIQRSLTHTCTRGLD